MDFAEGTRLVRVVPDVPHHAPAPRGPGVAVLRDEPAGTGSPPADTAGPQTEVPPGPADDARPTGAADAAADQSYLDELAEHDTVVLGRGEESDEDDPRVHIPAWEDIVFGVRRHR
jgi:hypothetical protein